MGGSARLNYFTVTFRKPLITFFIFDFSETLIEFNEISLPLCNAFFFGKKLDQRLNEMLRGVVGSLVVTWCIWSSDKICSTSKAIHVWLQVHYVQR